MDSFISWVGGKRLLRKQIISLFPSDIGRYIEVFGGAGWVLFGSDRHSKLEVYNDIDGNLVNLFRCAKYHAEELQRHILPLNARELFMDQLARQDLRGQTDIQRAADFFSIIKCSYGSNRQQFGCNVKALERSIALLPLVQQRLSKVVIEHKSFEDLIKVYDRPDALFYCDPPYHGTEDLYDADFGLTQHRALQKCLRTLKGRFILSYNDDLFIRDLYKDFTIIPTERSSNLTGRYGAKIYKELIIKNF